MSLQRRIRARSAVECAEHRVHPKWVQGPAHSVEEFPNCKWADDLCLVHSNVSGTLEVRHK